MVPQQPNLYTSLMPRETLTCQEAQSELAEIKSLKAEFDRAYEEAIKTGELEKAKKLRSDLESRVRNLREGLIAPLERTLDLKHQYESQRNILANTGILEQFPSGEHGIHGIDRKDYPMPSYQEIRNLIRAKKEILETKANQGFTKLLIVPFGMKLDDLTEKYGALLLKHKAENKLFATKTKDSDPDEALDLDTNEPVWRWDKYQNADVNGELVYDPKEFSPNHGGMTKAEILQKQTSAWRVIMVESDPNIPRETKGTEIGGRQRLEAGKTPNEYRAQIGKGDYQNESGATPEEWLIRAITTLEEKNQVIDDYQSTGSIAYNTGAYFPASGYVPSACWRRGSRQAGLNGDAPAARDDRIGAWSAVRVY